MGTVGITCQIDHARRLALIFDPLGEQQQALARLRGMSPGGMSVLGFGVLMVGGQ